MRQFNPQSIPYPDSLKTQADQVTAFLQSGAPYDLEWGCGVGMHPIQYINNNPTRRLIAVEKSPMRFRKFTDQMKQAQPYSSGQNRLLPVYGHAISLQVHILNAFYPPQQCFLMYPNPYLKKTQYNLRWHRMPFMGYFLDFCQPGFRFVLATNTPEYFEDAMQWYEREWGLIQSSQSHFDLAQFCEEKRVFRTHFEKKYLERGQLCYEAIFEKKS